MTFVTLFPPLFLFSLMSNFEYDFLNIHFSHFLSSFGPNLVLFYFYFPFSFALQKHPILQSRCSVSCYLILFLSLLKFILSRVSLHRFRSQG